MKKIISYAILLVVLFASTSFADPKLNEVDLYMVMANKMSWSIVHNYIFEKDVVGTKTLPGSTIKMISNALKNGGNTIDNKVYLEIDGRESGMGIWYVQYNKKNKTYKCAVADKNALFVAHRYNVYHLKAGK